MADDDDEYSFGGAYEDGHWIWDELVNNLIFVSDVPDTLDVTVAVTHKVTTGTIEFRDDIDILEQQRFRKRYQRKALPGQLDVITIQDVKDIAIYTAPTSLLSVRLINLLHISTIERFLRALILYCQYYLQIADEMTVRRKDLEKKVRTPDCDVVEEIFRENLCDLRTMVAKEYTLALIGGADTKKYHHMGVDKKSRSLSNKDAHLIETLLRMCVQIVWLALGRRCFSQLELELNRLFKTDIFNSAEHTLKTGYIEKMTHEERNVLHGHCLRRSRKLKTLSPLANEVFCHRPIDYRMMGLGVIKTPESHLTPRLRYLLMAISAPEEDLIPASVTVGILGLSRSEFDTMLRPLPAVETTQAKGKSKSSMGSSLGSSMGKSVSKKSGSNLEKHIYNSIILPEKSSVDPEFPVTFPAEPEPIRVCSPVQRLRWQNRLHKLYATSKKKK